VQVIKPSPFIRNSPKVLEGTAKVLPEANAKERTEVEAGDRINQSSLSLPLLHRTEVGG